MPDPAGLPAGAQGPTKAEVEAALAPFMKLTASREREPNTATGQAQGARPEAPPINRCDSGMEG